LSCIEFILTHLDLSSSNNDGELLEEIAADDEIIVQATITCVNIWEYFTSIELDEESGKLVNPDVKCVGHPNNRANHTKFVQVSHQLHFGRIRKIDSTCGFNQCWAVLTNNLKIGKIFKLVFRLKIVGFSNLVKTKLKT
jgi:hypothetical protein